MPLETAKDALDGTTLLGAGSTGIGFTATFAQYYPMVTGTMAFIIMALTIIHVSRKIKGSALDNKLKQLEIDEYSQKLKRRHDDELD